MADVTRRKSQETAPDLPLVKYLVSAGVGSRRHVVELVVDGKVRVNGERAESITLPVSSRDRVEVGGETVRAATAPPVYLLLNKPLGYLSTVHDDRGRPTVLDLVPQARRAPGLVPAGRLDLESSGLMLLTNDGDLVYRVTHPRYGVRKEYRVLLGLARAHGDGDGLGCGGYRLRWGWRRRWRCGGLPGTRRSRCTT